MREQPNLKKQILFVDDERPVLEALSRALRRQRDQWDIVCAGDGQEAWEQLLQAAYDAVVSDVRMPGLSGMELLQRMQSHEQTRDVPVVMITGLDDHGLKQQALSLGAADLLNKPVDSGQLVARLTNVLRLKEHLDQLKRSRDELEQTVYQQALELSRSRLELVCRLARAAEAHDEETGNHVVRVGCFSQAIARSLGCDEDFSERLLLAAPLHDIGKLGIPDRILQKAGPLSPGERAVMEQHCVIGERILREQSLGILSLIGPTSVNERLFEDARDPVLEMAASVALMHHEKWDGTGYPLNLAGCRIPLAARIVAVADVFDALTSRRPYRHAWSEEKALEYMHTQAGTHFDPKVLAAFFSGLSEIQAIRRKFQEHLKRSHAHEWPWWEEEPRSV